MASVGGKYADELMRTARDIATPGKGILAADESPVTMGKRLAEVGVQNTEENRRAYRELLLGARPALEAYLSGAILCEETLFQSAGEQGEGEGRGRRFVELLAEAGVAVGIKVDKGAVPLRPGSVETATEGLDGLAERCERYYAAGARFAKWRAVLRIDPAKGLPTDLAVAENVRSLARYAAICQSRGLVPIVEPELLTDGEHGIAECAAATERVLSALYKAMADEGVLLEGTLLKPSMVTPGAGAAGEVVTPEVVAGFTVQALQRTVPVAVPGVMFLSGGQSEEAACANLCAINRLTALKPWTLSFSYGRALQHSVLRTWKGSAQNVATARSLFTAVCRANSLASLAKSSPPPLPSGSSSSSTSLHVNNYAY